MSCNKRAILALGLAVAAGDAWAGSLAAVSLEVIGLPVEAISLPGVTASLPSFTAGVSGLGGAGTASGTGGAASWTVGASVVPGGAASGGGFISYVIPPAEAAALTLNSNPGAGAFSAGAPGGMAITGTLVLKYLGASFTLLGVPVALGSPGALTGSGPIAPVFGTTLGNAWTTGITSAQLQTAASGLVTTTLAGFNGLVDGVGTVVMVTSLILETNLGADLPLFAKLTLTYAPEPSGLLLVAGSLVALAWRRRERREIG
jgi:hypothetical protein